MANDLAISSALRGHFGHGEIALQVEEALVDYLAHRGAPVDEVAGKRISLLPASSLTPTLAWAFVADHLLTHLSLPVERLEVAAHRFARALRAAAAVGSIDAATAEVAAAAAEAARAELHRLDSLARHLRALPEAGRPGRELWKRDPAAYEAAMRRWESEQPVAREELEGGFGVASVDVHGLVLQHPRREETLELAVPPSIAALTRTGDRIDALLGRNGDRWFVMDAFAATSPLPPPHLHAQAAAEPR